MRRRATLRIFEEELRVLVSEIKRFPNTETGGALYGLWSHGGQPTVWLATRPGPRAERRHTYFADDPATHMALERGLWERFGVQCVGVWHSHHHLGMPVLSTGDIDRTRTYARHTGRQRFAEVLGYYLEDDRVGLKPWIYPRASDGHCIASRFEVLPGRSPLRRSLHTIGLERLGDALAPPSPSVRDGLVLEASEPRADGPADDGGGADPSRTARAVRAVEILVGEHVPEHWQEHLDLWTPEEGYVILEVGHTLGTSRLRVLFGWEGRLEVLRWEVVTGSPPLARAVAVADPDPQRRDDVAGLLAGGLQRLRDLVRGSVDELGSAPAVPPGDGETDPS